MQSALAEKLEGPFVSAEIIEGHTKTPGTVSPEKVATLIVAATRSEGFLGLESSRDEQGAPITRTYWTDADKAQMWSDLTGTQTQTEQHRGKSRGTVRIERVRQAMAELMPAPQKLVIGSLGNHWE